MAGMSTAIGIAAVGISLVLGNKSPMVPTYVGMSFPFGKSNLNNMSMKTLITWQHKQHKLAGHEVG